jgi:hypothetical protein
MAMYRTGILACSLLVAAAAYATDEKPTLDKDPNLVGWWKLDETSGAMAADSSRHQRHATLKGAASMEGISAPGRVGNAIRLDGKDTSLETPKYKGVTGTRPRTVAVWIKTATPEGEIISWGTEDFGQMFTLGFIRGRIGVTPHGGYYYMNAETHDDQWHHVAVVVRKAESPNLHDDVVLYLDGAPAEVHDIGLLDLWPIVTGNNLDVRVGRGFNGLLDDLRIYDRALSEEEINVLFKLQSDRPSTSSSSQRN